jgi:hypothetical protein
MLPQCVTCRILLPDDNKNIRICNKCDNKIKFFYDSGVIRFAENSNDDQLCHIMTHFTKSNSYDSFLGEFLTNRGKAKQSLDEYINTNIIVLMRIMQDKIIELTNIKQN